MFVKPKRKSGLNTLTAVTSTGAGTTVDFGLPPCRDVRYSIKATAVTTGGVIKFENSFDGTTWYVFGSSVTISATGNTSALVTTAGAGSARYWRANLTSRTDGTYTVDLSADSDY